MDAQDRAWLRAGIFLATTLAWILAAAPASAFDKQRRGFVLELGLGPTLSTAIQREIGQDGSLVEVGQLRLSGTWRLHLGYGISDRVALSFVNDVAFSLDDRSFYEDAFTLNGLSGAGLRWYQKPAAPSWYAEGAAGWARMTTPAGEGYDDEMSGFGLEGGGGFEFSRSWGVNFMARRLLYDRPGYDRYAFDLLISHIMY